MKIERLFLLASVLLAASVMAVHAEVMVADDFESYTSGAWPATNWVQDANAINDPSNNQVEASPGGREGQSLKLFGAIGGCWGSLGYRPFVPPPTFELEFDVYNGAETLSGCHPYRAYIGLRQGTSWTQASRALIQFQSDGQIWGESQLAPFEVLRWYHVKVGYNRTGNQLSLAYWIDGQSMGSTNLTIADASREDSLDHLDLTAEEGSVWFDNIRITVPQAADWPLRDKDLHGSRSGAGAACPVSLDAYSNAWDIAGADFVLTGDVQGDGKLEVVAWTSSTIKILDAAGAELHSIPVSSPNPGCLADVDGDGKKEILTGKREDDNSLSIYVFKGDGTQLNKLSAQGSGQSDQGISPLFVADIDGDKQLEIVSAGDSGYAIQWRGLEATSLSTGNSKWRIDVGPTTTWGYPTRLGDLAGNGSLQIVQGSGGPANGRVGADGSVDYASYTWQFDAVTGQATWRRQYDCCGFFDSNAFLPDLNGDGRPEIVTTTRAHGWYMADYGVGTINILNPADGTTLNSINFGHDTEDGMFGNLDGQPGDEIVVMTYEDTTGHLRAFGDNLTPKGDYSRAGGWFHPRAICDLNGDGSPEIVAVFRDASGASNDTLVILNAALTQVLREIDLGEPDIHDVIVSDVDGNGSIEILTTLTDKVVVLAASGCAADADGDGVSDSIDQCPDTPVGGIVSADGCSLDQLVPCAGPVSGGTWKNHGQYVSSVAAAAEKFLNDGLITKAQKEATVRAAAKSRCGRK